MQPLFFSKPDRPLYGVFHSASAGSTSSRAALICPPIGHEYIRTHWGLRILANQLSRLNVSVLRMEYAGVGDSYGELDEVKSIETWLANIEEAVAQLKELSGAEKVVCVGLRFGANLSALASEQVDSIAANVLWDPILKGEVILKQHREMHWEMVDLWVNRVATQDDETAEEILGFKFARTLLNQIEEHELDLQSLMKPQLVVSNADSGNFGHQVDGAQRLVNVTDHDGWGELVNLEASWLRPATTKLVVKNTVELFERLEQKAFIPFPALENFSAMTTKMGVVR